MVNDKKFSIVYLEDDPIDALNFVEAVQHALQEAEPVYEMQSFSREDPCLTQNMEKFLFRTGIVWERNTQKMIQRIEAKRPQLIILDMKIDLNIEGWDMADKISQELGDNIPTIWILTNYGHFRAKMLDKVRVSQFIAKDITGWTRLSHMLHDEYLKDKNEDPSKYIELPDQYNHPALFEVVQIVTIETRKKPGADSRYQEHMVYIRDDRTGIAKRRKLYEGCDLMKCINDQIRKRKIRDLVQVSQNAAVNVRYIEKGEKGDRCILITMNQRGDTNKIKATNTYLDNLYKAIGEPLV